MLKIFLEKSLERSPSVLDMKDARFSLLLKSHLPRSRTFPQELLSLGSADLSVVIVSGGGPGAVWAALARCFVNRQSSERYRSD